jgi:hypothetical protein
MNKLYILGLIFTLSNILSVTNADEYYDDDDFQTNNNAMINVRLYNNKSECLNQLNSLYYYHKNFNIDCDCFKLNSCFDKLKDSKKLEDYSFKYNNYSYNLNELNFTNKCYMKNGLYIYNELNIFLYCGRRIFLFVFIILIFVAVLANIKYFTQKRKKKNKYKLTNRTSPPDYNTLN